MKSEVLLNAIYHMPLFGQPDRRFAIDHLIWFLELAAIHDKCAIPLFMWPNGTTWFVPAETVIKMWNNWMCAYGFTDEITEQLVEVIDYPVNPNKWISMEDHLGSMDVPKETVNSLVHSVLQAEFARRSGYSYAPDPTLAEMFANDAVPKLEVQLNDVLLKAYNELKIAINKDWTILRAEGRKADLRMPPLAAYVLKRSSTITDIASELLAVREEIKTVRSALREYQYVILDPATPIAKALKARAELHAVLKELKVPSDQQMTSIFEWTDVITLPEQLFDGPDWEDFKSSSILKFLLTKPAEILVRLWRRRKVGILVRAKKAMYNMDVRAELKRLFGASALKND